MRVHSNVARQAWAKAWYYLRYLDRRGCGIITVSFKETLQKLRCASSTFYEQLRAAKEVGAIQYYKRIGDSLRVWLGSLYRACWGLEFRSWGATSYVDIDEILGWGCLPCRRISTKIATQRLQEKSRFAAIKSLSKQERDFYKLPHPCQFFESPEEEKQPSDQLPRGENKIPFVIHVGEKRIFVSRGFVPFGASLHGIQDNILEFSTLEYTQSGASKRTISRHLRQGGVKRKQIVQTKTAYSFIKAGIAVKVDYTVAEPGIYCEEVYDPSIKRCRKILYEPNGITQSRKPDGFQVSYDRFFSYWGKTWLYRCNLYDLNYQLTSMKRRRKGYEKLCADICELDRNIRETYRNLSFSSAAVGGASTYVLQCVSSIRPFPGGGDK